MSPLTEFLNANWKHEYEEAILPALRSLLSALGSGLAVGMIPAAEGRAAARIAQIAVTRLIPEIPGSSAVTRQMNAHAITKLHQQADRAEPPEDAIYRAAAVLLEELPHLPLATLERLRRCKRGRACPRPWFWDATYAACQRYCSGACRTAACRSRARRAR